MASQVLKGDYEGLAIVPTVMGLQVNKWFKTITLLNSDTVESYELIDEETRKSASSAVGRAAVGSLLLGPVGLLAGLSAKSKGKYLVAVKFRDGKESLLDLDKKAYNQFVRDCY